METKDYLQEILKTLKDINKKIEGIADSQSLISESLDRFKPEKPKKLPLDVDTLLDLPDHLRETVRRVGELGSASAEHVAAQTHKTRAAESDYLNQLVKMGYLQKERRGRTVFFSIWKGQT